MFISLLTLLGVCGFCILVASGVEDVKSTPSKSTTTTTTSISDEQIDATLKDRRYLLRQLKCATGEAPCDSVGRRLKSLAPLVLRGACPQCTPQETKQIQKVLGFVQKNYPKEWNRILQQYAG